MFERVWSVGRGRLCYLFGSRAGSPGALGSVVNFMSLLLTVITAAHARGTHHYLVLDGVARLQGPNADAWRRLLFKHAGALVEGAKAPDELFKDFKNHVLHPRDGYWGGAPAKARAWYVDLVEACRRADWPAAAWSAGVLSHYVTDPVQPFHTAQSEAENAIHRAAEWSISRSYAELKRLPEADASSMSDVHDGERWLEDLLCQAALDANQQYEKLIAHYDIKRGVVDPPSGLDEVSRPLVARQIGRAISLYAVVLQRAFAEANVTPPDVNLTLDVVVAGLKVPVNKVLKKIADRRERATVEAIYDELMATGKVEKALPEDDRTVRDAYAREVLAPRAAAATKKGGATPAATVDRSASEDAERQRRLGNRATQAPAATGHSALGPVDPPRPAPRALDQERPLPPVARFPGEPIPPLIASEADPDAPASAVTAQPVSLLSALQRSEVEAAARRFDDAPMAIVAPPPERVAPEPAESRAKRVYLTLDAPIVDAPSIGPRLADRLAPLGVLKVRDLLAGDAEGIATRIGHAGITAEEVLDWQAQCRLVLDIPELRGTHAQLLVGAGVRTAEEVAAIAPEQLSARLLAFAASPKGQRILRQGNPPDVERIKSWVVNAREALAA